MVTMTTIISVNCSWQEPSVEEDCTREQELYFNDLKYLTHNCLAFLVLLYFLFSREYSAEDPEDQDLWWAVRHRCYLSEVFSLLSTNGYEKVAEKFAVMLR